MAAKQRTRISCGIYITVILIGAGLTLLSLFSKANSTDLEKNIFSMLCSLGTGVLASGIIGWFFDAMNTRISNSIVAYKRECVLAGVKAGVQSFLNESGNKYFELNRLVYNTILDPAEIDVADIFSIGKAFEIKFLNEFGNNQIGHGHLTKYINGLYGKDTSIGLLKNIADKILLDKDTYVINGILYKEEVEILETLSICADNIEALVSKQDYVGAVAYVESFYDKIHAMISSIDEFKGFASMRFMKYTIRGRD